MTAEEAAEFERFKQEKVKKETAAKAKEDCQAYAELVDEEIAWAIPVLLDISGLITGKKSLVLDRFAKILEMKADVLKKTKEDQRSHTWTNTEGDKRITIGRYFVDAWRDTVNDGIEIARSAIMDMIQDDNTKALVNQMLRMLSRNSQGDLKANKVLQLEKLAADVKDENIRERIREGIAIINEAHIPNFTKTFIRAEYRDVHGQWHNIPLGMTEA